MNKSAFSVDLGYADMSALIDKNQIVGAHKKHLNLHEKNKLLEIPKRTEESLNRSRLKKEMFAKVEQEAPPKITANREEEHYNIHVNGDLKEQYHLLRQSFIYEEKERQCLQLSERGNLWIILALLAGICYAFNNFFLGQLSHHGLVAVIYVNIPSFFLFMMVYAVNFIRNKFLHGFFWCREISIFFKEEDNTFDWSIFTGVFLMSFCKFCGFCLVVMTFHFANAAGMNLGIITVIFNFCCITDSVVFYFVFKEKLSMSQLLGSGVLLLSAVFIAKKPDNSTDSAIKSYGRFPNELEADYLARVESIERDHYYNSMVAIGTALCCTLFFSARDVILRYFKVNKHYPAFELSLDSLTMYSFACCLYALYLFGFQGLVFEWSSFYAGCMSAVLNTCGFMMLGISVVIGYAGPANALNSIQAVVLTFLGVSMMNQIPTQSQTTGMLLGMLGTIIVSIGDAILKMFKKCIREMRGQVNEDQYFQDDDKQDDYQKLKD